MAKHDCSVWSPNRLVCFTVVCWLALSKAKIPRDVNIMCDRVVCGQRVAVDQAIRCTGTADPPPTIRLSVSVNGTRLYPAATGPRRSAGGNDTGSEGFLRSPEAMTSQTGNGSDEGGRHRRHIRPETMTSQTGNRSDETGRHRRHIRPETMTSQTGNRSVETGRHSGHIREDVGRGKEDEEEEEEGEDGGGEGELELQWEIGNSNEDANKEMNGLGAKRDAVLEILMRRRREDELGGAEGVESLEGRTDENFTVLGEGLEDDGGGGGGGSTRGGGGFRVPSGLVGRTISVACHVSNRFGWRLVNSSIDVVENYPPDLVSYGSQQGSDFDSDSDSDSGRAGHDLAPKDVHITCAGRRCDEVGVLNVDDAIGCTARGHPPPLISMKLQDTRVIDGSFYQLNYSDVGQLKIVCLAKNLYGSMSTTSTIKVRGGKKSVPLLLFKDMPESGDGSTSLRANATWFVLIVTLSLVILRNVQLLFHSAPLDRN